MPQSDKSTDPSKGKSPVTVAQTSGAVDFLKGFKLGSSNRSAGPSGQSSGSSSFFNLGNLKSVSALMIVLGLAEFFIRLYLQADTAVFILSLFLFVLAGYALAQKLERDHAAILLPMFLFVVWYFFFDANYTPLFLLYFLLISAFILFLTAFLTKGSAILPEIYGFLPVLFLFLDLGFIPFLVEKLNLTVTPFLENLMLFMPWWAFFGLLTLPTSTVENKTISFILGLLKIVGILYILFVFVVPSVPDLGYEKSLLPAAGELYAAQKVIQAKIPQRENPAYSNMACLFSDPSNLPRCVTERQELSELRAICKAKELDEGSLVFNECLEKEREKKKNPSAKVEGVVDPTIKFPTTAQLKIDPTQFSTVYDPKIPVVASLSLQNPRKQELTVEVQCNFTGKGVPSVNGEIQGGQKEGKTPGSKILTLSEVAFETSFLCKAMAPLEGDYNVFFAAEFQNLETKSRLRRAFVGTKTAEQKEKLFKEEIVKAVPIAKSQSPADFAWIDFDLGHSSKKVVIENNPNLNLVLASKIHNNALGKITTVHRYAIDVPGFVPQAGDQVCLEGNVLSVEDKEILLPSCLIVSYPPELKEVSDWVVREFEAVLNYNYQISAKAQIKVVK